MLGYTQAVRVGLLSDTHGLLRPQVLDRLSDCDRLIHAGDVGDPLILESLQELAPTWAVRGNMDTVAPLTALPAEIEDDLAGWRCLVVHRRVDALELLSKRPSDQPTVVIYGHSHRPEIEWQGNTLLINPGACGGRRFRLPLTVARLTIVGERIVPELLSVEPIEPTEPIESIEPSP